MCRNAAKKPGRLLHHTHIATCDCLTSSTRSPDTRTQVRGNVKHHSSFTSSTKTWSQASTFHAPHLWHTRPNVSVIVAATMFNSQWPKTANQRDDETNRWSKMWPLTPHSRTSTGTCVLGFFFFFSLSVMAASPKAAASYELISLIKHSVALCTCLKHQSVNKIHWSRNHFLWVRVNVLFIETLGHGI